MALYHYGMSQSLTQYNVHHYIEEVHRQTPYAFQSFDA